MFTYMGSCADCGLKLSCSGGMPISSYCSSCLRKREQASDFENRLIALEKIVESLQKQLSGKVIDRDDKSNILSTS